MAKFMFGVALFLAVCLAAAMVWSVSQIRAASPAEGIAEGVPLSEPARFADMTVPETLLVNERGESVELTEELRGEGYTVLSFVFTHCELVCPIMNGNVYRLTQELAGQPVRFVGVSVDPVNDTPERLREYLGTFENVPEGVWTMLTGAAGQTERLVTDMGFLIEEDMDDANIIQLPDGRTMRNIVHPVRFLVFDPDGRVVGSYRGNNPEEVDELSADLKRVLASRGMLN